MLRGTVTGIKKPAFKLTMIADTLPKKVQETQKNAEMGEENNEAPELIDENGKFIF